MVNQGVMTADSFHSEERLDRAVPVEEGGTLYVDLDRGTVEITSHDAPEVRVQASSRGWASAMCCFTLSRQGRDVQLDGDVDGWLPGWFVPGLRMEVRAWVPRRYSVEVTSRGGHVSISEIGGAVAAQTSGGRLELRRVNGPVLLRTSGGRITAEEINGDVRARTSGARIDLAYVNGDIEARTSGGSIEVQGAAGAIDARTSGGGITASFVDEPSGRLETSGGSIEVTMPADVGVDLDARTSGGQVRLDRELVLKGRERRHHVSGEINGGGPTLTVRTSGGSIRIRAA
jgi:hypothetical protein